MYELYLQLLVYEPNPAAQTSSDTHGVGPRRVTGRSDPLEAVADGRARTAGRAGGEGLGWPASSPLVLNFK